MQLLFMDQWLADSFVKATCWTLVHSLWQGLILAAIAGLLVLLTRKSVAALRYNLLATLFFVFMAVVAFTFVYELRINAPANTTIQLTQIQVVPVAGPLAQPDNAVQVYHEESFVSRFTGYFNQHASLIVTIWFIIFMAKAVKLMGGLAYIQRIRNHKVYAPATKWTERLEELADKLGVRVPVRLLESGLVKVPMVAGFLKPIILVPVGLLANLPADQVEAILLHELAHIRRRDFMVNLLQSFAEILFFFNPAVLWLSSLIREEREHCCDDMAITITQSKKEYIEALVSFQEYQLDHAADFAMAFPGKKNQLLNRVKRIIGNSNKSLNMAEKYFLALCLCIMCILSVVVSQTKQPEKKAEMSKQKQALPADHDIPGGKKDNSSHSIAELKEPDELTAMQKMEADARKRDSFTNPYHHQYDSVYKPYYADRTSYQPYQANYRQYYTTDTVPLFHNPGTVISGVITTTKNGKEYKINVENNRTTGLTVDGERIPDNKLPDYYSIISSIYDDMAEEAIQRKGNSGNRVTPDSNDLKKNQQHPKGLNVNLSTLRVQPNSQLNVNLTPIRSEAIDPKSKITLRKPLKPERSPAEDIIDDMVAQGIVKETNPLSFRLNKNEFTVNGVRQSEEVRRSFQDKYVKHTSDRYEYDRSGGKTSTSITREK